MKRPQQPPVPHQDYKYAELLDLLISRHKLNEFFQIEDIEYPYFEKWKYKAKDWGIPDDKLWSLVKQSRYRKQTIQLLKDKNFQFSFSSPSIIQEYLHKLDLNLGGTLQSGSLIPEEDKHSYLLSSLMEEAIASSQIEGAVTTRRVAKEMLEKNQPPLNKSQQMIHNNYNTMKWIVDNKDIELSKEVILHIHKLITSNTLHDPKYEGELRDNNRINIVDETNEIFYTPPDHEKLDELLKQFLKYANDTNVQKGFIHPILKGILLHFLIGYIHPFMDGNGRTARALFYWYLIKKGYWLIEYMSVSRMILKAKSQYAKAYLHTEYDENDLTYFFIYNLRCISEALEELKTYVDRKIKEKAASVQLLRKHDFNQRQVYILQELLKDSNQYFTAKEMESKFGISNQTARTDLQKLVTQGFLIQRNNGRLMTFFANEQLRHKLKK